MSADCKHEQRVLPEVVARQQRVVCRKCGESLGTLVRPAPIPRCSREGCTHPGIWLDSDGMPTCDVHQHGGVQ